MLKVYNQPSHGLDVVAGKGAELVGGKTGAHEPAVIASLHHADDVTLSQRQLVGVLRPVRVDRLVPVKNEYTA